MAVPEITSLPNAPQRTDLPATFSQRADEFVAALQPFRNELVAAIDWQNTTFIATENAKNAAQTSESNAASSATTAVNARDKAQDWAEAGVGVEVETGKYSALHWSDQAQTYSAAAQSAAGVPSLTGNSSKVLTVSNDELSVQWQDVIHQDYQEFTSSGTWNKNPNARWVYVEAIGGGGGGAARGANLTQDVGGGGGGAFNSKLFRASDLPSSVTVTVGFGGNDGSAATASDVDSGGNGANTVFDSVIARGGQGGAYTSVNIISIGGNGGGGELGASDTFPAGGGYSSGGGGFGLNNDVDSGGNCVRGGAGGAGHGNSSGSGGISSDGGNGGGVGQDGLYPGGGGGGRAFTSGGGLAGAGANGRLRVWQW